MLPLIGLVLLRVPLEGDLSHHYIAVTLSWNAPPPNPPPGPPPMKLEQLGHDVLSDRDLYVLAVDRVEELPAGFRVPSQHFVCLVVGDTLRFGEGDLHRLAETLLRAGAVYLSVWGPGSGRARALFDDAILMSGYETSNDAVIPTAAHDEELGEALNFLLLCTGAAPAFEASCHGALVLLIGASDHAETVRQALGDPQAFVTGFCGQEGAA